MGDDTRIGSESIHIMEEDRVVRVSLTAEEAEELEGKLPLILTDESNGWSVIIRGPKTK